MESFLFFCCRSSLLLSTSLPSSQQSPDTKRKSWMPGTVASSGTICGAQDPDSPEIPLSNEEAKTEALDLIYQLNSVFRYKHSEMGLNKLKGKYAKIFQDLCFYSDVCQVLGEYDFRINARKFVQVLFGSLDISQVRCRFLPKHYCRILNSVRILKILLRRGIKKWPISYVKNIS